MSIFDKIGNVVSKWWDINTDILHGISGVPTAEQKRDRANLVNSQMKAYKDQTEIAQKTQQDAREQISAEKRRLADKQVAALRRHFAPSNISSSSDLPNTLGA